MSGIPMWATYGQNKGSRLCVCVYVHKCVWLCVCVCQCVHTDIRSYSFPFFLFLFLNGRRRRRASEKKVKGSCKKSPAVFNGGRPKSTTERDTTRERTTVTLWFFRPWVWWITWLLQSDVTNQIWHSSNNEKASMFPFSHSSSFFLFFFFFSHF